MASMDTRKQITTWVDTNREDLIETTNEIFKHPEISLEEKVSSKILADYLEKQGFTVTWGLAGFETAFVAEWGYGKPVLGFLAEYDALPGLGQETCSTRKAIEGPGHGCGHNLLGTACAGAAGALKSWMETEEREGTIRVYGCPAEEIVIGKIHMNEAGVFDDLSAAITWHPFDRNRVSYDIWQAQDIKNYTFHGLSSHAAKAPEKGRSALDAAELMNVGVNYLREHVPGDVRMHYAYIDNGLPANVVPDIAKTNYFIRSYLRSRTEDASERVDNCARGAALMTDTTVDIELVASCSEMKVNRVLTELYYDAMTRIPTPAYTPEELDFAKQITEEAGLVNDGIYTS